MKPLAGRVSLGVAARLLAAVAIVVLAAAPSAAGGDEPPGPSALDRMVDSLPNEATPAGKAIRLEQDRDNQASPDRPGIFRAFVDSWPLFHNTYLSGWLIAVTLSVVGVLVVARNQIFIGAAVAQASMLGMAAGLWAGGLVWFETATWMKSDNFLSSLAVGSSVVAALLTARTTEPGKESLEVLTGWVFLLAASVSILIISHSPHGLDEVQRLLSSSIIGSTTTDVLVFAALASLTILWSVLFGRRLLLFSLDPEMAGAVGLNVSLWIALFCIWLGLTVGLSVRASGVLYTFGMLVLPAVAAKNLCREIWPMFLVSPLLAVLTATAGFILDNQYDYPPAQMAVALLSLLLLAAWLVRRLRRRLS